MIIDIIRMPLFLVLIGLADFGFQERFPNVDVIASRLISEGQILSDFSEMFHAFKSGTSDISHC